MSTAMKRLGLSTLLSTSMAIGAASAQEAGIRVGAQDDRPAAVIVQEGDAQAQGESIRRVGEILGGEARGPGDEGRIAAISDLIMDGRGNPQFLLLSRGGVAGIGGEKIAVPFGVAPLTYAEDGGWRIDLPMTGEQLEQAPTLEEGSLDQLRDPNWLQSVRQFFQADAADAAETVDADTLLFRASALKGAQVRGTTGDESIASVDDVLLGPDFRAEYAVLGFGGVAGLGKNQVPAPFEALRLNAEAEDDRYVLVVHLDTTKERLHGETAPRLDGDYNRMLDPTFTDRVRSFFEGGAADTGTDATGAVEVNPQP